MEHVQCTVWDEDYDAYLHPTSCCTPTHTHICTCDLSQCICSDKSICLINHNFLLSVKSCWREFLFFLSFCFVTLCSCPPPPPPPPPLSLSSPHRRSLPLWCPLTCSNATPHSTSNSLCRSTGLSNGVHILGVAWLWVRPSRIALRGRRRKRA